MNYTKIQVVILAGGKGTRLRECVSDRPKAMASINGRPFLSRLIELWGNQCGMEVMLSVGYMKSYIQDYYGDSYNGIKIRYVEEDVPLGTGGALRMALKESSLKNKFVLVVNGDTWFPVDIRAMMQRLDVLRTSICIGGCYVAKSDRYGRVNVDKRGLVEAFLAPADIAGWINGGVYLMRREDVSRMTDDMEQAFPLEKLLMRRVKVRDVAFMGYDEIFIDIGVPSDYRNAQRLLIDC